MRSLGSATCVIAALLGEHFDALGRLTFGEMLDRFQQCRVVSLAHNLVELRGPHPGLLHLLERSARIHALMLGGVSDHQNAVLGLDLFKEGPHLFGAGKAGLVQHVEMWAGSRCARVVLASGKETLQRRGFDSFLSKLTGCAGRGGETFDLVAVLFRTFTDDWPGPWFCRFLRVPERRGCGRGM